MSTGTLARWLLPLAIVLACFNLGAEDYRADTPAMRELERAPTSVLWPPWRPLVLYMSRDSDDRLYFHYANLALGRPADLPFIASRRATGVAALRVDERPGPRLPHRDFSIEYPPGAWAAILPPAAVTSTLAGYRLVFGLWMCALAFAGVLCALSARALVDPSELRKVARASAWIAFALGPLFVVRYDALPALATAGAVLLAMRGRAGWAGLALGLGGAAKIYPLLCAPVMMAALWGAAERQAALRLAAGAALGAGLVLAPFWLAAGPGLLADLRLHASRPLHFESVLATPLLFWPSAQVVRSFGSPNLEAPGALVAARASGPLLGLALAGSAALAFHLGRAGRAHALAVGTAVAGLAVLVVAKVLSPQFLLWVFPLVLIVPGAPGRRLRLWFGLAALLGQVWYPFFYNSLAELEQPWVSLLVLRNALLVLALADLARALLRRPDP